MRFQIERRIERPAAEVFAASADFAGAPARIPGIVAVEMLTAGPVGVGTRFRETRVMFGREASETMEVAEFEAGRRYLLVADSCGCRFLSEVRVEPERDGARWTLEVRSEPRSLLARVFGFAMGPMATAMRRACEKDADDLKASLEAGTPA
jgi:hypothetical protein